VETGRRYGIHAQSARQVEQTYEQLIRDRPPPKTDRSRATAAEQKTASDEPLLRCLLAGFVDQLCKRRDTGTLDCDLTEAHGNSRRESVVQNSPLFVAASIREFPDAARKI